MAKRTEFNEEELDSCYNAVGLSLEARLELADMLLAISEKLILPPYRKDPKRYLLKILDPLVYYLTNFGQFSHFMVLVHANEVPTLKELIDNNIFQLKCESCIGVRPDGSRRVAQTILEDMAIDNLTQDDLIDNTRGTSNFGPVAQIELLAVGLLYKTVRRILCPSPDVRLRNKDQNSAFISPEVLSKA